MLQAVNFSLILLEQLFFLCNLSPKQIHGVDVGCELFFDLANAVDVGFMVKVVVVGRRRERDAWEAARQSDPVLAMCENETSEDITCWPLPVHTPL